MINFILAHSAELWLKTQEQAYLVTLTLLLAMLVGVPLGMLASRFKCLRAPALSITSILWTIPSLALLAFLIPWFGIGVTPALIALTIYALLPIVRNTVTGLEGVSDPIQEAAIGLGFTRWQRLRLIEFPLALPVIMSGVRTASAMTVGIATLAAFIGAGGLGDLINRGLATNNTDLILLGAIPAAMMALVLDTALAQFEGFFKIAQHRTLSVKIKVIIASLIIGLLPLSLIAREITFSDKSNTVTIATKNFTEQYILGELMAQLITHDTKLKVIKKFNLGTTAIVQAAMERGEVDIYPEYTGTGYITILKKQYKKQNKKILYNIR